MTGQAVLLARSESMKLVLPECSKGIGSVILSPDSPKLIEGVRIQPIALWPDDRGYFLEVQRIGHGLAAHFPPATSQISAALNYPGNIKAFHFHLHQTDCWTPAMGMFQVALADLREGSPTYGERNMIGREPAMLVYMTDRFYNPSDEGRTPYNQPGINYDWETQYK